MHARRRRATDTPLGGTFFHVDQGLCGPVARVWLLSNKTHRTMRTHTLLIALLSTSLQAQTTHTLVATDFQFTPDLLTIEVGDSINLFLGAGHSFTQVSATTWNLGQGYPTLGLDIGVFPQATEHMLAPQTPDTLYYVCVPHVNMGMKGRIVILPSTIGMDESALSNAPLYPNPVVDRLRIPGAIAFRARLYDPMGRMALDAPVRGGFVDVRGIASGQYLVHVLNAQGGLLQREVVLVLE